MGCCGYGMADAGALGLRKAWGAPWGPQATPVPGTQPLHPVLCRCPRWEPQGGDSSGGGGLSRAPSCPRGPWGPSSPPAHTLVPSRPPGDGEALPLPAAAGAVPRVRPQPRASACPPHPDQLLGGGGHPQHPHGDRRLQGQHGDTPWGQQQPWMQRGSPHSSLGGHPDACVCGPPPAATLPKAVLLVHSGGALYLLFEKNPKLSLFCCFGEGSGEGALGWAVLKPP